MSSGSCLQFAADCLSYFVKVAVAYLLCWFLSRLLTSPRRRFAVWLGFLVGSLGYWVYILSSSFWFSQLSGIAPGESSVGNAHLLLLPERFQQPTIVLCRLLGGTYIAGVMFLLAAGVWKRIRLHFLLRHGAAPPLELRSLFSEMCRSFRVRNCELLVLGKVNSPATVCWWRPRILLPQVCSELGDSAAMADVLYHELAHVARRDYFWSSLGDLICRLLFFHPGVWQARKQMSVHREMACDLAVVVARPEHRIDYAQTLTRVARLCLSRKHPVIGIDFAAAPSLLTHRIHAILNDPEHSSRIKNLSRAVAALALIGVYVFLCSLAAVAVAFAPANHPVRSVEGHAILKPQMLHPHSLRRSANAPKTASAAESESLITESPAYRLTASPDSADYASKAGTSGNSGDESASSNIPGWAPPRPSANSKSAGRTVESVIVTTVGTVIGIDREERKRKDDSNH